MSSPSPESRSGGVYSTREVARLVDLPVSRIRALTRAGIVCPEHGEHGRLLFSFQDLSLLRAAGGLLRAKIPPRRVTRALRKLRAQVPASRPLSSVQIAALRDEIVAREGTIEWEPESGQTRLDFAPARSEGVGSDLAGRRTTRSPPVTADVDAATWYERGATLESTDAVAAEAAFRRAIELDPEHAESHLSLGLLLHERGDVRAAERHYRDALAVRPEVTAAFNLAVALDDQQRRTEAVAAYEYVLVLDDANADAHYNLSRLCELLGRSERAIRHLKEYKRLTDNR